MNSATLTPANTQDLIQLRALLDRALNESQSSSPLSRLTGVILLDGANERAMHIAASSLSLEVSEYEKYETFYSKLKAKLGAAWNSSSWTDVRQLHRVRNLAQHVGIAADRDKLPVWAAATQRYVNSLIESAMGVDLTSVRLGDAVERSKLRELLNSAESRLQEHDFVGSVRASSDAFHTAIREWQSDDTSKLTESDFRPWDSQIADSKSFEYLEKSISPLQELGQVQVFTSDPSEYLWFRSIGRHGADSINAADAQRALSFVFWWIIRWEAFAATTPEALKLESSRRQRRVRESPVAASPDNIVDVTYKNGTYTILIKLADVPEDAGFDNWRHIATQSINSKLPSRASGAKARIDQAGVVTISHKLADFTASQLMSALGDGLVEAEERIRNARIAHEETEQRLAAEASTFVQAVTFPYWAKSIQLNTKRVGSFAPLSSVTIHVADTILPHIIHVCESLRYTAMNKFSTQRHQIDRGFDQITIGLKLSPEELTNFLADATKQIEDTLSSIESKLAADHRLARRTHEALIAEISKP